MTNSMLKNIIETINHELKNGLIYVVIEDDYNYYKSYEPITIYNDSEEISINDEDDNYITLPLKVVESIKIAEI